MSNRTFTRSHADYHRFLVAGVAGAVVGFFSNFALSAGSSISPLAVAFLAGYAVDVFFSFLDGLIQASMKKSTSPTPPATRVD
jgi:putative flippase GtrA